MWPWATWIRVKELISHRIGSVSTKRFTVIMGIKYLAVFTAALFLLVLIKCCSAAGGSMATEDPCSAYLTVLITK